MSETVTVDVAEMSMQAPRMGLTLKASARSHCGNVRSLNEDSFWCGDGVFVVADGMGGHDGGEVASALAIEHLERLRTPVRPTQGDVAVAIAAANDAIYSTGRHDARSMGTTVTGVVVTALFGRLGFTTLNVGDSRTYVLHGGDLQQLTMDHSHVQELVDGGSISRVEARHHPERNVITRALGIDAHVTADLQQIEPRSGDRFLVCSDGLTGELDDDAIRLLLGSGECAEAAQRLLDSALGCPARDNITLVVLDVLEVVDLATDHSDDVTDRAVRVPITDGLVRSAPAAVGAVDQELIDDVPAAVRSESNHTPPSAPALIADVPMPSGSPDTGAPRVVP